MRREEDSEEEEWEMGMRERAGTVSGDTTYNCCVLLCCVCVLLTKRQLDVDCAYVRHTEKL